MSQKQQEAELHEDRRRLDWLDADPDRVARVSHHFEVAGGQLTIRQVIDWARRREKEI